MKITYLKSCRFANKLETGKYLDRIILVDVARRGEYLCLGVCLQHDNSKNDLQKTICLMSNQGFINPIWVGQ